MNNFINTSWYYLFCWRHVWHICNGKIDNKRQQNNIKLH